MAEQTTGPQAAKPRTYTDEYRRQVVDMVTTTGRTAMLVAAELAETRSVCGWARVGDVPRVPGVGGEPAGLRRGRVLRLACQAGKRAGGREQVAAGGHPRSSCREVHAASQGRYGSPRVHAALRARGRSAGRGRIERLMRVHGVRGLVAGLHHQPPPRLPGRPHPAGSCPWRLPRREGRQSRPWQFTASKPNQVWLADLTYIPTGEGWLYMAAIMDLHTRKPDAERQS